MRTTTWGFVALAAAGLALSGCSEDGDTFLLGENVELVPTRADSVASNLTDNWADNENAINPAGLGVISRTFQCCDGSAIMALVQVDDSGIEELYFLFYDASGSVVGISRARGDFGTSGVLSTSAPTSTISSTKFGDTLQDMAVVWTPNGDAAIAFQALQAAEPSSSTDLVSERVYYGSFRRSVARQVNGPNGELFGFSSFSAVDTNTDGTDDNGVHTVFALSNGIDGAVTFTGSNAALEMSGFRGDNATNLTPVIFLGWIYDDSNNDLRVEGYFVDVNDGDNDQDTLELTSTSPSQISFSSIGTGESVDAIVWASGAEGVFRARDNDGNGQDRMWLVRVDPTGPSLESPIEISRGTNTNTMASDILGIRVIGDGFRAYNGQDTTWVIFEDDNYTDGTVTQADEDLLIAQVDGSGTVELDEFDHEGVASVDTNDLQNFTVQVKRGATRAFIYYQQVFDADVTAAEQNNDALFVRALRLNGAEALADNVSAEATINSLQNSDGFSDPDDDTDVEDFFLADADPLCDADVNNDTSYVVFIQELDNDTAGNGDDSVTVRARLVTIDDITVSPITITLDGEETLFSDVDEDEFTPLVQVFPGSASTGEGLVLMAAPGNNISDDDATGQFGEPRPFFYASALPNSQSVTTPLQIGSDASTAPVLPFGDFNSLAVESLFGIVTPNRGASRDFAFDDDELAPQALHLVFGEFLADPNDAASTWVGRRVDLRDNNSFGAAADRFTPSLDEVPAAVGPTAAVSLIYPDFPNVVLLPSGNDVVAVFNVSRPDGSGGIMGPPGDTSGQIYMNTSSNGVWSDAALLSNDDEGALANDGIIGPGGGIGFFSTEDVWAVIPGLSSDCCPTSQNSFVFWLRLELSGGFSSITAKLQGRRITGSSLPRR